MNTDNITIDSYKDIAPKGTVELICHLAERLRGRSILHVNSTRYGGGVAEMLHRLIPLFNNLGIKVRWEVLEGSALFYQTTKNFHNALQGRAQNVSQQMYDEYKAINEKNAQRISFDSDLTITHDPQPAALIHKREQGQKWLWRCHIDVSRPQRRVWNFLKGYVSQYDGAIFSLPSFAQKLPVPQFLMYPSIDPLSDKNRQLTDDEINRVIARHNIPRDKPVILQVSRFDRFKDPLGVIQAYNMVKKYNDCILILAGGAATDDPEGAQVLQDAYDAAAEDKDIFVLNLPPDAHIEINALQRIAAVILQKSTKEGFGLTVAEAMWKGKPVIGGAVGGITTQIIYGRTGYTVNSIEGCAYRIRYLLSNPSRLAAIGESGREYTRGNFLITRHICDYLALITYLLR